MTKASLAETGSVLHGLYLDLLTGIKSGEYPPKSTLPTEGSLANDYGVTRTVVRSALAMLKKRGIVRSQQGSGTVVACCDLQKLNLPDFNNRLSELKDCYACRVAIEPEIAAHLALHPSKSADAYLRTQLTDLEKGQQCCPEEGSHGAASDADFHIRLAGFTQNSFFSSIMSEMRPHMLFSMNIKKYLTRSAQENHITLSRLEHQEVIMAILDRDAGATRKVMRNHIANGRNRIFPKDLGQAIAEIASTR